MTRLRLLLLAALAACASDQEPLERFDAARGADAATSLDAATGPQPPADGKITTARDAAIDAPASPPDATIPDARPADGRVSPPDAMIPPKPLPTVADLWNGSARVALEGKGLGASFAMHFISPLWLNGVLNAYYITAGSSGPGSFATGLATSADGVSFKNQGRVLDIGGGWQWGYGPTELSHQVGRAQDGGWSANTGQDAAGFLSFGPYVTTLPRGANTVSWVFEIDNNVADDLPIVTIDIHDATASKVLASRVISRKDFVATFKQQTFNLSYEQSAGNSIEFRAYWHKHAWVRQHTVAVSQGKAPFFDQRIASFADVWKQGSTYYMVYEAAGLSPSLPGDIGLATSRDGRTWVKHHKRPILQHSSTGWEQTNIGTPSLWYENGTWYLFYHGYAGQDVQIGVATGTSLTNLTKYAGNPILRAQSGWDSGTLGVRSIVKQGGYYYMVYEGSTDPPYDTASWSSGLARSTDLIHWTKFSGNPVLPVTGSGFGNDGPAWVKTPDGIQHIYYRGPGNQTYRGTLVWK